MKLTLLLFMLFTFNFNEVNKEQIMISQTRSSVPFINEAIIAWDAFVFYENTNSIWSINTPSEVSVFYKMTKNIICKNDDMMAVLGQTITEGAKFRASRAENLGNGVVNALVNKNDGKRGPLKKVLKYPFLA